MTKNELLKVFKNKKERIDSRTGKLVQGFKKTTFNEFHAWFDLTVFSEGCHYCGLTNGESANLFKMQREGIRQDGTRGGKRGRRLEIDRKDPSQSYDNLNNIVWCCYWCNNAKSNFFTEAEFIPIGIEIGKSLRLILSTK